MPSASNAGHKALVTGGAGLIGSHLTDLLLERGCAVRILDNLDPRVHPLETMPPWIATEAEWLGGDIRDPSVWDRALQGVRVVFHEAAIGGFLPQTIPYFDVNVTGTAQLFEALKRAPAVEKVIMASSQAVYGPGAYRCPTHGPVPAAGDRPLNQLRRGCWEVLCPQCRAPMDPVPLREDFLVRPATAYALSKLFAEQVAVAAGRLLEIPVVILRYALTYGPRQSLHNPYTGICSIFANLLRSGRPVVLHEDGLQTRDFIYVGDVARANLFAYETSALDGQIVNVGTGIGTPILEFAKLLAQQLEVPFARATRSTFRSVDARHVVTSCEKVGQLGFVAHYTLSMGLKAYCDWFQEQPLAPDSFTDGYTTLTRSGIIHETT